MDRNEAFRRRVAESVTSEAADDSSDEEEQTQIVREGATRAIDTDPLASTLDVPPRLPEMTDVSNAAPTGSSTGSLTDPLGSGLGGSSLAGGLRGRAEALGGDALGRGVDLDLGSLGRDRNVERAISNRDGSQIGMGVEIGPITVIVNEPIEFDISPEMDVEIGDIDVVNPAGSGDEIIEPGYAQPDPTSGDEVITGESAAAAVRAHAGGDPGISRPTEEASVTGYATNLADNDPQNITNYGPEGPQNVEVGDNWAPPSDGIFDPPPEASAAMAGGEMAMADPAAAMGGSVIGSGVPEDFPPPPDPPPGDEPVGPPPDGGGDS